MRGSQADANEVFTVIQVAEYGDGGNEAGPGGAVITSREKFYPGQKMCVALGQEVVPLAVRI